MVSHNIAPKGKMDISVTVRGHWIQTMSSLFNRKPNQTCGPLRKESVASQASQSQGSTGHGNEEEAFFDLDEGALSQLPPHLQNNMRELRLQRMMRLATQNQYRTTQRPVNLTPQDDSHWSMPIPAALDGYHDVQSHAASSPRWRNSLETIVGLKIPSAPQEPRQYNATLCELETTLSCPHYMEILQPEVDISEYEQFGVPLCRSNEMKNGSFGKQSFASNIRIRVERSIHRLNKLFKKLNNREIYTWKQRREICTC